MPQQLPRFQTLVLAHATDYEQSRNALGEAISYGEIRIPQVPFQ